MLCQSVLLHTGRKYYHSLNTALCTEDSIFQHHVRDGHLKVALTQNGPLGLVWWGWFLSWVWLWVSLYLHSLLPSSDAHHTFPILYSETMANIKIFNISQPILLQLYRAINWKCNQFCHCLFGSANKHFLCFNLTEKHKTLCLRETNLQF